MGNKWILDEAEDGLPQSQLDGRQDALARLDKVGEAIAANQRYWEGQLEEAVAEARKQGARWEDIGASLGMTKQAAHERFARPRTMRTPFAGVLMTVDNIRRPWRR